MSTLKCPRPPCWKYSIGCWKYLYFQRGVGAAKVGFTGISLANEATEVNEISQNEKKRREELTMEDKTD